MSKWPLVLFSINNECCIWIWNQFKTFFVSFFFCHIEGSDDRKWSPLWKPIRVGLHLNVNCGMRVATDAVYDHVVSLKTVLSRIRRLLFILKCIRMWLLRVDGVMYSRIHLGLKGNRNFYQSSAINNVYYYYSNVTIDVNGYLARWLFIDVDFKRSSNISAHISTALIVPLTRGVSFFSLLKYFRYVCSMYTF